MGFQQSLLNTKDENEIERARHNEQMSFLPVSNLQERYEGTPELSSREFEIMQMTLSGIEIAEIAKKIFLSVAGVKWRLSQVYWKFNAENRLQLINKAATEGLHFFTESGIKHSFSVNVDMQGHLKKEPATNDTATKVVGK